MPVENHPRWRTSAALGMIVALALLASACSSKEGTSSGPTTTAAPESANGRTGDLEPDDPPVMGGKIVVDLPAEVNGLNPVVNQWSDAGSFMGASMLEPLVLLDTDGNWKPYLLEKWDHNADFTEWDLTLRPGVSFHNGTPLDGTALKRNIDAFYLGPLGGIVVGKTYKSVEVTGPLSVHVALNEKWAQYPSSLSTYYIMAAEQLDEPENKGVYKAIGTGPFEFEEWKQGTHLKLKKYKNYWRKDKNGVQLPYLDAIEFHPVVDEAAKQSDLSNGNADLALTASAKVAKALETDFTVIRDYASERSFIMLNTAQADFNYDDPSLPPVFNPLTNVHARRALAYATDREAIAALMGADVTVTTQGYRADSKWGLPEDQSGYYPFDQAKAKEEIELFKKDTGKDTLAFSVTGLKDIENTQVLQALQEQWKKVGIDAKVQPEEQSKTTILFALGQFQAGFFRWYGWLNPDFNYMFNSSTTSSKIGGLSINFTHYTSKTMDENLAVVRSTEDFATRKAANDKVIREINDQAILTWLYDTPYAIIADKKVRGLNSFRINPFGNFAPKPWWGEVWVQT